MTSRNLDERPRRARLAIILCIFIATTSCSGGGDGGLVVNEIAMMSLGLMSNPNAIYIGHPVDLETVIVVRDADEDITVSFFLLAKADVDAQLETPRQYPIGSDRRASVAPGENRQRCRILIPGEILAEDGSVAATLVPGLYYLTACADEPGLRKEHDRSDNALPTDALVVDLKATLLPNLVVTDLEGSDDDVVVLHDDDGGLYVPEPGIVDQPNDHLDATVTVLAEGTTTVSGARITAYFEVSGTGVGPTQQLLPLEIWNSAIDPTTGASIGQYATDLVLPDLAPAAALSLHLDLHIPAASRATLTQIMSTSADFNHQLVVMIDEFDAIPELGASAGLGSEIDNVVTGEVVVIPPDPEPPTTGVRYGQIYAKDWKSDRFGVGVDLSAEARFEEDGATQAVVCRIPVTLFGFDADFSRFEIDAHHEPGEEQDSFVSARLRMFGQEIWQTSGGYQAQRAFEPLYEHEFLDEWTTLWLGPVPVTVEGKVSGGLELGLGYGIEDQFYVELQPSIVGLQGTITVGLGLKGMQVGFGGRLTLLEDIISLRTDCGMTLVNNDTALQGQLSFSVINDLRGPNGQIFVFVTWPRIGWSWKGPYLEKPGMTKRILVEWIPFSRKDVLFKKVAPVVTIPIP